MRNRWIYFRLYSLATMSSYTDVIIRRVYFVIQTRHTPSPLCYIIESSIISDKFLVSSGQLSLLHKGNNWIRHRVKIKCFICDFRLVHHKYDIKQSENSNIPFPSVRVQVSSSFKDFHSENFVYTLHRRYYTDPHKSHSQHDDAAIHI